MNYKHFVPPVIFTAYRWLRGLDRPPKGPSYHTIGDLRVELPAGAALPHYQSRHRLYDRFLPVLAKHVDGDGLIVDVGANVGDTVVAMLQHCHNPFLCVEPSEVFLPFLKRNIAALPAAMKDRVEIVQHLVGTGEFTGVLQHTIGGTAGLVKGSGPTTAPLPLDTILGERVGKVALLKVDTDGFDHDVLLSAGRVLEQSQPILFWENQAFDATADHAYQRMYARLSEQGYTVFHVFDNFGTPMLMHTDLRSLADLNAYIVAQNKHGATRTIHYTDVLACTGKDQAKVDAAMEQYLRTWVQREP